MHRAVRLFQERKFHHSLKTQRKLKRTHAFSLSLSQVLALISLSRPTRQPCSDCGQCPQESRRPHEVRWTHTAKNSSFAVPTKSQTPTELSRSRRRSALYCTSTPNEAHDLANTSVKVPLDFEREKKVDDDSRRIHETSIASSARLARSRDRPPPAAFLGFKKRPSRLGTPVSTRPVTKKVKSEIPTAVCFKSAVSLGQDTRGLLRVRLPRVFCAFSTESHFGFLKTERLTLRTASP